MKQTTIAAFALVGLVNATFAEVNVTVKEISDQRTTGGFFKGLELTLKLQGSELTEAKGISISLESAKDDLGTDISKIERFGFDPGGFQPLVDKFGRGKKGEEFEHHLKLPNPARAAKKVMLSGFVKLLVPAKDPASIITINPVKEAGKAIDNPLLKSGGAAVTFSAPKANTAGYTISDPNGLVAAIEFCSADGKPLDTTSKSSSDMGGSKIIAISFRDKPSEDMVAKLYLVTEKSVVTVPLKFDSITLP